MKYFALIAAVAAIQDPNASYKAKADSLSAVNAAVAQQKKFAADHEAMHTANMDRADAECDAQKLHVRLARET